MSHTLEMHKSLGVPLAFPLLSFLWPCTFPFPPLHGPPRRHPIRIDYPEELLSADVEANLLFGPDASHHLVADLDTGDPRLVLDGSPFLHDNSPIRLPVCLVLKLAGPRIGLKRS